MSDPNQGATTAPETTADSSKGAPPTYAGARKPAWLLPLFCELSGIALGASLGSAITGAVTSAQAAAAEEAAIEAAEKAKSSLYGGVH